MDSQWNSSEKTILYCILSPNRSISPFVDPELGHVKRRKIETTALASAPIQTHSVTIRPARKKNPHIEPRKEVASVSSGDQSSGNNKQESSDDESSENIIEESSHANKSEESSEEESSDEEESQVESGPKQSVGKVEETLETSKDKSSSSSEESSSEKSSSEEDSSSSEESSSEESSSDEETDNETLSQGGPPDEVPIEYQPVPALDSINIPKNLSKKKQQAVRNMKGTAPAHVHFAENVVTEEFEENDGLLLDDNGEPFKVSWNSKSRSNHDAYIHKSISRIQRAHLPKHKS